MLQNKGDPADAADCESRGKLCAQSTHRFYSRTLDKDLCEIIAVMKDQLQVKACNCKNQFCGHSKLLLKVPDGPIGKKHAPSILFQPTLKCPFCEQRGGNEGRVII